MPKKERNALSSQGTLYTATAKRFSQIKQVLEKLLFSKIFGICINNTQIRSEAQLNNCG